MSTPNLTTWQQAVIDRLASEGARVDVERVGADGVSIHAVIASWPFDYRCVIAPNGGLRTRS